MSYSASAKELEQMFLYVTICWGMLPWSCPNNMKHMLFQAIAGRDGSNPTKGYLRENIHLFQ